MIELTDKQISKEEFRMNIEQLFTGRILLVGTGESQKFWKDIRRQLGIKWYEFWRDEVDELNRFLKKKNKK